MKIGMNSQTLRILDGEKGMDYHIDDGKTASIFMAIIGHKAKADANLADYEKNPIVESDPMSWGTDKDKMTDINYTEVGASTTPSMRTGSRSPKNHTNYSMPSTNYGTRVNCMVIPSPPKPRNTFTSTDENKKNFGKLFGN